MIEWSLDAFRACAAVRSIVVATPPGGQVPGLDGGGDEAPSGTGRPGAAGRSGAALRVVAGGATRSRSVANALEGVDTELVAIHDGARPLLTPELVEGTIATLEADPEAAGAIAAAPVTDTVKRVEASASTASDVLFIPGMNNTSLAVAETLDRQRLWVAQTPQVFWTEALRAALEVSEAQRDAATDEATLVEAAGGRVLIHPSPAQNLKVTTPLDLRVAELLLGEGRARGRGSA